MQYLIAVTLAFSVGVNSYFLYTNFAILIAVAWAITEVVQFFLPRKWWSIPIKSLVQVISLLLTILCMTGMLNNDANVYTNVTSDQQEVDRQLAVLDADIQRLELESYQSRDPQYIVARQELLDKLIVLGTTPFTYYGKRQPDTFAEASQNCKPTTDRGRKVTRDYPSTCSALLATTAKLDALELQYNSESARLTELKKAQDARAELYRTRPKLGQDNSQVLTNRLSEVFNLGSIGPNLLVFLTIAIAIAITAVNYAASLGLILAAPLTRETMRTGAGLTGYNPADALGFVEIPDNLGVNTKPDSLFAAVLAKTIAHHQPGHPINKDKIKSYHKCSNDIAQAVINTLASNNMLEKESRCWKWI